MSWEDPQSLMFIDIFRAISFTGGRMFLRILGVTSLVLLIACATGDNGDQSTGGNGDGGGETPVSAIDLDKIEKVDFVKHIKPIFEYNCVACHREGWAEEKGGGYQMDIKEKALKGRRIRPGDHERSMVWESMTLPLDDEEVMPPKEKDQRPTKEEIALVARWIDEGATWPDGLQLTAKKKIVKGADENKIVEAIHTKIMAKHKPVAEAEMKPFVDKIPNTLSDFTMVPIRGGTFLMGSPAGEKGRDINEGPQRRVQVSPFWIGKHEVTWDDYHEFMYYQKKKFENESSKWWLEQVATPTKPYVNMDFGMGTGQHPAISMTQHAANKYCQWLSAKTGHFYRLPTEAEWEYACRAGMTTAFSWGNEDDRATLNAHTRYAANSMDPITFGMQYTKIGLKKPNPWGLHDMHGNVAEWVLDGGAPYKGSKSLLLDPWVKGTGPYPHVSRGGSFHADHPTSKLRSAARIFSNPNWKQQDPQLPKSIWYLTDATFQGMRLVRPLKVPTKAEMKAYWNNGVEYDVPVD